MNEKLKQEWKKTWQEIKIEMFDNNWNGVKALLSMVLPMIGFFYLYKKWMLLLEPYLQEYSKASSIITQHDAVISLCILIAYIGPIFLVFPVYEGGVALGLATGFFKHTKTRSLFWDKKNYFVRDMSEDDRKQITEILSKYKSKLQMKKERLENASWLRRNFS